MKAVRVHQYGGPEVLKYEEVAVPQPAVGQVRVKIEAIAFKRLRFGTDSAQRERVHAE
jgi:NADPH:quinone reductase-like Zn-dependent oxidoreductase